MKMFSISILLFVISSTAVFGDTIFSIFDYEPHSTKERAIRWISENSPQTFIRFDLVSIKIGLETHYIDSNGLNSLRDFFKDEEQHSITPLNRFGKMNSDDFCITTPALQYIYHCWSAEIASGNNRMKKEYEFHKKTAEEILKIDWYMGIVENELIRSDVDAAAKKYVSEFLDLRFFNSEDAQIDFIKILSKDQIQKRYIIKPLCIEPPIIELGLEKLLFTLFDEFAQESDSSY